jgi:hypothetical protein
MSRAYLYHTKFSQNSNVSIGSASYFYSASTYLTLEEGSTINAYSFTDSHFRGTVRLISSSLVFVREYDGLGGYRFHNMAALSTYGDFTLEQTSVKLGAYSRTRLNIRGRVRGKVRTGLGSLLKLDISETAAMSGAGMFWENIDQ